MISIPLFSQCVECSRFRGVKWLGDEESSERIVCKAFPDGIPIEIIANIFDHDKPYPGDHGIRFSPLIK